MQAVRYSIVHQDNLRVESQSTLMVLNYLGRHKRTLPFAMMIYQIPWAADCKRFILSKCITHVQLPFTVWLAMAFDFSAAQP